MLRLHAASRPDHRAIVFEGRVTDYLALDRITTQVAHRLLAAGLSCGDRIGYLGKNSDRYFFLLYGAAKAGLVTVPVNWRLSGGEVSDILADAQIRMLFADASFIGTASGLTKDAATQVPVIAMEGCDGFAGFEGWVNAQPATDQVTAAKAHDAVVQLYTSGTTGFPKGVMLTHENFFAARLACAKANVGWDNWTLADVSLNTMPVGHIGGTGWGVMALYHGGTMVVHRDFDALRCLAAIRDDSITKLFLVPTAMQAVVDQCNAAHWDVSRLRHVLYGASAISPSLLIQAMALLGCGFVQLYGMTETCGAVVALAPEDHALSDAHVLGSAGRPLPGVTIMVAGPDGMALPAGQVGEILIRSPSAMIGYWRLAAETKDTIDVHGWLHSGDAGYLDDQGYLHIVDRVKEMIVSGGENVYPAEVERAILTHPAVAEAAVIGVPDNRWGEAVAAVVVLRDSCHAEAEEIIRWTRARIAGFKVPKSVAFAESLPRTATGKLLRRELKAPYWAGCPRQVG